jgi:hypothetical protein
VAISGAEGEDPERLPPKFSLRHVNKKYCITQCTKDEKAAFAVRLRELSELTWAQLRQAPRHGLGFETIDRSSIKCGIPGVVTADVSIIAFRFDGKKAMVGFRDSDGTFHIIWFDRAFQLYKH